MSRSPPTIAQGVIWLSGVATATAFQALSVGRGEAGEDDDANADTSRLHR